MSRIPLTSAFMQELRIAVGHALSLLSQASTIHAEQSVEELRERWSLIDKIDNSEITKLAADLKAKEEQLNRLMAANLELHVLWQQAQRDLLKRRSEEQVGTENETLRQEIKRFQKESTELQAAYDDLLSDCHPDAHLGAVEKG